MLGILMWVMTKDDVSEWMERRIWHPVSNRPCNFAHSLWNSIVEGHWQVSSEKISRPRRDAFDVPLYTSGATEAERMYAAGEISLEVLNRMIEAHKRFTSMTNIAESDKKEADSFDRDLAKQHVRHRSIDVNTSLLLISPFLLLTTPCASRLSPTPPSPLSQLPAGFFEAEATYGSYAPAGFVGQAKIFTARGEITKEFHLHDKYHDSIDSIDEHAARLAHLLQERQDRARGEHLAATPASPKGAIDRLADAVGAKLSGGRSRGERLNSLGSDAAGLEMGRIALTSPEAQSTTPVGGGAPAPARALAPSFTSTDSRSPRTPRSRTPSDYKRSPRLRRSSVAPLTSSSQSPREAKVGRVNRSSSVVFGNSAPLGRVAELRRASSFS